MAEEKRQDQERETAIAKAAYNFVPFSETVLYRYDSVDEIPSLLGMDPGLRSGEIHYTLTAHTPVFSGAWSGFSFYRGPGGRYALPASTIRGQVRTNMSILTLGKAEVSKMRFRYAQLHKPKEGKLRLAPARRYWEVLGIEDLARREAGEELPKIFVPRNVHSGYLRKRGGKFYIRPAVREAYRLSPTHPLMNNPSFTGKKVLKVYYSDEGGKLTTLQTESAPGLKRGNLLRIYRKTSYLFAEEDLSAETIPLSHEVIDMHQQSGFRMPGEKEAVPVFFIRYKEAGEKQEWIYFGQKRFLNIGFRYAMDAGLPPAHREDAGKIDYPNGIFGKRSFASRVSFEDCVLEGEPCWAEPVRKRAFPPQPAYYPNYVAEGQSYNDSGFRLRGYKQYWLKDPKTETGTQEALEGVRDYVPLASGSRFRGVIRFRNLHRDELGALLWALKLNDGCFQSVGRGRAEGYGRMKVELDRLMTYDVQKHYTGLLPACREETEHVQDYIRAYIAEADSRLPDGKRLHERPEIQDFLYIRSKICSGQWVESMDRKMCRDVREPLPTIRQIREGEAEFC